MVFPNFKNKHLEEAIIDPDDFTAYFKEKTRLPKKCIIIYNKKLLKYFLAKYKPRKIKFNSVSDIYIHKNVGCIKIKGFGSPCAAVNLEELIVKGAKIFLSVGNAGGLKHKGIFLCNKAIRDEGTSHHYLPEGKFSYPDMKLTNDFGKYLQRRKIKFFRGGTWTIDAIYRETEAEARKYAKQDIATVEMEASALFSVAKYRKVKIASIFVVSDLLIKKWEPLFHVKETKNSLKLIFDATLDYLIKTN